MRFQPSAPACRGVLALAAGLVAASAAQGDQVDFEGLPTGLIVDQVMSVGGAGPILISGSNSSFPGQNTAVIFDTANPTGGDADLGTPHSDFGGPGSGSGGAMGSAAQNDTPLGKVLIIAEDLDLDMNGHVADPDDEGNTSGVMHFDFAAVGTVTIHSVTSIDVESMQEPHVVLFDANDNVLADVIIPVAGDNGVLVTDIGSVSGVVRMEFRTDGSTACPGFEFDVDCNGAIGDYVWRDLNDNGIQDMDETGIEGVSIELQDGMGNPLASTTTDANGAYLFEGLCAGDYTVVVDANTLPDGYVAAMCNVGMDDTVDNDCSPATTTLGANDSEDRSLDFGYVPEPFVYCDSLPNSTGMDATIGYSGISRCR